MENQAKTGVNTYAKFAPNVFIAKCEEQHEKGETIVLTTKYGQEHECEVVNYMGTKGGFFYYSIIRLDGMNSQERARRKAERLERAAANAEKRSIAYWEASHEGKEFLSLGEPIKVGHHSEKRHRALIERNFNRMEKSIKEGKRAEEYAARAEYWKDKEAQINLSMPESVEYYAFLVEKYTQEHAELKAHPEKRAHSMSLQYANKRLKEAKNNHELAFKLWG